MRRLAALLVLAGCTADEPTAQVYTLGDLIWAAESGYEILGQPGGRFIALPGEPIVPLAPPFSPEVVRQDPDITGVNLIAGFTEGRPVAYPVTEVWEDLDTVWVQPMYQAITGFRNGQPVPAQNARLVFSVGPESAFYSPYWELFYVLVPEGTDADTLRRAEDILNGGFELVPANGQLCSLSPRKVALSRPAGAATAVHPFTGARLGAALEGEGAWGWANGEKVYVLAFGTGFTWDDQRVVREDPLFRFVTPDGQLSGLPTVGGVRPLFGPAGPGTIGNRPAAGGLWRIVDVKLPRVAVPDPKEGETGPLPFTGPAAFVPENLSALRQQLSSRGVLVPGQFILEIDGRVAQVPEIAPEIAARDDVNAFVGRVTLNAACFADPVGFPGSCRFLDSQDRIESQLTAWRFSSTRTLVTCPYAAEVP